MYTYKGKMLFYNNVFFGELLGQMMKKWKKEIKMGSSVWVTVHSDKQCSNRL